MKLPTEILDGIEVKVIEIAKKHGYQYLHATPKMKQALQEFAVASIEIALQHSPKWVPVEERLPEINDKTDNSDNVLVWCDGGLAVMHLSLIPYEDESGVSKWGKVWCNCYGDITGDGEHDDDYKPSHWMPLPCAPSPSTPK